MKKTFALLAAAAVLVLSGCYTTHDMDKYTNITQVSAADEGAPAYPGTPRVAPHMVHKH